jgi:hypothetical protein
MPRLGVRPGWLASRNRDSGKARSRVFRFAEHACVRAGQDQRHLANDRAVYVGDGISIRFAQDRQPMAIRNCCRNFLARQ